jgi:hexokinase
VFLFFVVCSDNGACSAKTQATLQQFGLDASEDDIAIVRETTEMISRRAAYIVAAGKFFSV